jgi:hypothetical protein
MKMVGQPLFIFIVHSILKGMIKCIIYDILCNIHGDFNVEVDNYVNIIWTGLSSSSHMQPTNWYEHGCKFMSYNIITYLMIVYSMELQTLWSTLIKPSCT